MNLINQRLLNNNINPNFFDKVNKNFKDNKNNINDNNNTKSFKDVLNSEASNNVHNVNNVQFSKHASNRLENRNLNLSTEQIKRVEQGILKAKQKGVTDSLVLVDDIALVVNIKNNMVVTAIQNNSDKIYTNINGAVIV